MTKMHADAPLLIKAAGAVHAALSPRERAVLLAAARGAEDKEIAADLGCTVSTVRTLWQRIYRKTRTASRRRLIATLWQEACRLASCHFLNDVTTAFDSPRIVRDRSLANSDVDRTTNQAEVIECSLK